MLTIKYGRISLGSRAKLWKMKTAHERIPLDKWVHTAATWDGYNITLYVDGQEMYGKSFDSPATKDSSYESANAFIGGHQYYEEYQFNGSIMDLFVFGTVLSRDNIMKVYQGKLF